MKSFAPSQLARDLPMGMAWLLGAVLECRGRQTLFEHQKPELLATLRQRAIIQSAESSNRIEGVTVEAGRLRPLVLGKTRPKDRSEQDIVGYRQASDWVHRGYEDISIRPSTLQKLHQLAQTGSGDAGQWKRHDSDIIELLPDGRRRVRFRTIPATQVEDAIDQLCLAYGHASDQGHLLPLVAAASFVLDLLCIHPFRDGNGRVSRLITLLLLYRQGFRVGRYVSLERIVEESKDEYYEALAQASEGWHDAEHDPIPWWSYFLSVLRQAYTEFESRIEDFEDRRGSKTDLVTHVIGELPETFRLSEVAAACPSVSRDLIRHVLRRLRDQGEIESVGTGRSAKWRKTNLENV